MTHRIPHLARTALAGATLALAAVGAQAITLVGLTSANELAMIDTSNIAGATTTAITGLAAGDRLVGIDLRPKDSKIYGISLSNNIYTIDASSGAASLVAALSAPVINPTLGYGIDFNPMADFGVAASLRLVSSAGNNYAVNASTGVVGNTASNIGNGFSGVAYSNTSQNPSAAPAATSLYYINSVTDSLSVAGTGFNAPALSFVGNLGIDVLKASGFEVVFDGTTNMGIAALNVDNGSLATGLYSINLSTGAATSLGTYNGTLSGLTVSPVPEPQTLALMLAGLVAVGALAQRRRAV